MKDNDTAVLVVWMGKPTVGKLIEVCVAAAARILPQTAYENDETLTIENGKVKSNQNEPHFLNSYINKWDGKTVIPACGYDLFGDTIKYALEDGVIFTREQDFVVFEPLPIWEIKHLLGEEKFNEIIDNYNSTRR